MTSGSSSSFARRTLVGATEALVVAPSPSLVRAVVGLLCECRGDDADDDPAERVRLLCDPTDAEAAFDDFLLSADAADAVEAGRLAVRTDPSLDAGVTLADGAVHAHVPLGDGSERPAESGPTGGAVDTPEFVPVGGADGAVYDAVAACYEARWDEADGLDLGVPGRSALLASFRDRWPDACDTLAGAFAAVESAPREDVLAPVTVCTLVAARHDVLVMRLSEWAEEVGFSSRTEIARAKATLVDAGLVDTERVPAGVGRPRHRLVLADAGLAEADPAALVAAARESIPQ